MNLMGRLLSFIVLLALLLSTPKMTTIRAQENATPEAESDAPYRVVGYYASWAIYGREYFVTDVRGDLLTHLNYAFALISEDGEVVLGDEWADTQYPYPDDPADAELLGNFRQLQLLKAANSQLQTMISIGGWTGSGRFSDVALTAESREKFAHSAVDFMIRYGFDGVDIDWEYPTGGGEVGNVERPEDPENFVLLLAELRAQLDAQGAVDGRHYPLTIAASASPTSNSQLDWSRIEPLLDWVNVMTYDMSGPWSEVTGFNAPLYDSQEDPPEGISTDSSIQAFLALGLPADKVVLGIPFYGPGWSGVAATNNGLHQPFTDIPQGTFEGGTFEYGDIAANYLDTYARFWDETAQVPWLYNADTGIMIVYEDPESIALKASYVREHGLGGIMFWELSLDSDDAALLSAVYEGLNAP